MTSLQVYSNPEFGTISVLIIDGKEMFPATECAKLLGYANPYDAIGRHAKGVVKHAVLTSGGEQLINLITEGDLFRLIVHSKLPAAERFEHWVFDEVLPSVRKHGAYMTEATIDRVLADPDFGIRLLTKLKDEQNKNALLTAQNEDLSVRLNESEKFWTIMKFNQHFHMGWDMKTCQRMGKAASSYSRQHGYEIRKCQTNDDRFKETNSYAYEVLETLFLPRRQGLTV